MKPTFLAFGLLFLCAPAWADEHKQKLEELLIVMQAPQALENMKIKVEDAVRKQIEANKSRLISDSDKAILNDNNDLFEKYSKDVNEIIREQFSWNNYKQGYIDAYASVFSDTELDQLLEFYKSDVGKMLAAKSILLNEKLLKLGEEQNLVYLPKFIQLQNELVREAQKRTAMNLIKNMPIPAENGTH